MIDGQSTQIQGTLRSAELIAATGVTTLIQGNAGVGKSRFARLLHDKSPRSDAALVVFDCASQANEQLFGYARNEAKGLMDNHLGVIAQADKGSLFLKHVDALSEGDQKKLVHYLQTGQALREGVSQSYSYDVRIIVSTNHDLMNLIQTGNFRQDLFYLLNVVPLNVPALSERKGDLQALIPAMMRELVAEHKKPEPTFSKESLKWMSQYVWPGNLAELRNFCERMLILLSGQVVEPTNLPQEMRQLREKKDSFLLDLPEQGIQLEALEMDLYQQAIQNSRGNKTAAARLLGLSRDAFLYRLKKFGLR